MKVFVVLLALPVLGLCQDLILRIPPNCFGQEEGFRRLEMCVSTMQNCGGGTYTDNNCTCKTGYMTGGTRGKICIPKCTGTTKTCANVGGNCTAVNFCSCGSGSRFSNGKCISSTSDKCGGKCYLGTCTTGTCKCPQDYQLNADKTNCEPIGNCPSNSLVVLPNLCQCIGSSFYLNGACSNITSSYSTSTTDESTPTTDEST